MNLSKLTFFFALMIALVACGDDDSSGSCTQADWVGTYNGTMTCDGEDPVDVVITITASGSNAVVVAYEEDGLSSEYDPITIDGCNLGFSGEDSGITLSLDASINGDNLSMEEKLSFGGATSTCDFSATRN